MKKIIIYSRVLLTILIIFLSHFSSNKIIIHGRPIPVLFSHQPVKPVIDEYQRLAKVIY